MHWLNYHHLLYFWTVARTGSVTAAAEELHLSRPTVPEQIRNLERSLDNKLFQSTGRRLALTDFGERVLTYADEIFSAGQELQRVVRGGQGEAQRLIVGVDDDVHTLAEDVEIAVSHQRRDFDQLVVRRVETGHLAVDPHQFVLHAVNPSDSRGQSPSLR